MSLFDPSQTPTLRKSFGQKVPKNTTFLSTFCTQKSAKNCRSLTSSGSKDRQKVPFWHFLTPHLHLSNDFAGAGNHQKVRKTRFYAFFITFCLHFRPRTHALSHLTRPTRTEMAEKWPKMAENGHFRHFSPFLSSPSPTQPLCPLACIISDAFFRHFRHFGHFFALFRPFLTTFSTIFDPTPKNRNFQKKSTLSALALSSKSSKPPPRPDPPKH